MPVKAAVLTAFQKPLELREYPSPPDPQPGEAIVRVEMAGICGTDVHLWLGQLSIPAAGDSRPRNRRTPRETGRGPGQRLAREQARRRGSRHLGQFNHLRRVLLLPPEAPADPLRRPQGLWHLVLRERSPAPSRRVRGVHRPARRHRPVQNPRCRSHRRGDRRRLRFGDGDSRHRARAHRVGRRRRHTRLRTRGAGGAGDRPSVGRGACDRGRRTPPPPSSSPADLEPMRSSTLAHCPTSSNATARFSPKRDLSEPTS